MPIKHEVKPSALLALRQHAECFVLCMARARLHVNCFKVLYHKYLVKVQVRRGSGLPIQHYCHYLNKFASKFNSCYINFQKKNFCGSALSTKYF